MQTSKERVRKAIAFEEPDKVPLCLDFDKDQLNIAITKEIIQEYEADILIISSQDPEFVPVGEGYSQWGYKMENFGETMGEVKNPPLENWENYETWEKALPDFTSKSRYVQAAEMRKEFPDKYLVGGLGMMMEEIINLRGYADYMADFFEEEENLNRLIDCLYEKGKQMVDGYAEAGMDGVMAWEAWGLQTGPMMSYGLWKKFFYKRMRDFVDYIHKKGMKYFLHSCGHITYLLDTFVDFGVDVIQLDQQKNMGLDELHKWAGKICFFCPVDIQHSVDMPQEEMKEYIKEMVQKLGTQKGGMMYKAYPQPAAIHMTEAKLRKEIEIFKAMKY